MQRRRRNERGYQQSIGPHCTEVRKKVSFGQTLHMNTRQVSEQSLGKTFFEYLNILYHLKVVCFFLSLLSLTAWFLISHDNFHSLVVL